jgi:transcriptional regulator with XRE-family HTH domain
MSSKIKIYRKAQNLNQVEVANQLNMAQNTYSRYEANPSQFTDEQLDILSNLFDKPVEELLEQDSKVNINHGTWNNVENFGGENHNANTYNTKELIDKLLERSDAEVARLQKMLAEAHDMLKQLMDKK